MKMYALIWALITCPNITYNPSKLEQNYYITLINPDGCRAIRYPIVNTPLKSIVFK